jgi:hypothetical protein
MLYRRVAHLGMFIVPGGIDLNDDDPATKERIKTRKEDDIDKQGMLFKPPRRLYDTCQLSAKLHCLYGWYLGFEKLHPQVFYPGYLRLSWEQKYHLPSSTWRFACKKVYDLREYGINHLGYWDPARLTSRGPFMEPGTQVKVDWQKLEAIMFILGQNIENLGWFSFPFLSKQFEMKFAGCWNDSYIPWMLAMEESNKEDNEDKKQRVANTPGEPSELDQMDPYGVSGTWLRILSFIGEWQHHIFSIPQPPWFPALTDFVSIHIDRELFQLINHSYGGFLASPPCSPRTLDQKKKPSCRVTPAGYQS